MSEALVIVDALLEADDPKEWARQNVAMPDPRITTTFTKITWGGDTGDPDDFIDEHGFENEEGVSMLPDEFDREEGLDTADLAIKWLRDSGASQPSSSHFYPGIWYSTESQQDMRTGAHTERSFHLKGFRPDEEEKIFKTLAKNRYRPY